MTRRDIPEEVGGEPPNAEVTAVLTLYYEHPDVISAFGWPSRPPQPLGHTLPPFDEDLLAPVKARGEIWRRKD